MKCIYLGAKLHRINRPGFEFHYNDIFPYPDIDYWCDMRSVNLNDFDLIIATPPCNYYSRANAFYKTSKVANETKVLLPYCIDSCIKSGKHFLIENTYSKRVPINTGCWEYIYGSHIFYSDLFLDWWLLPKYEFQNIKNRRYGDRDNNINVHRVIDLFLDKVMEICKYE